MVRGLAVDLECLGILCLSFIYNPLHTARRAMAAAPPLPLDGGRRYMGLQILSSADITGHAGAALSPTPRTPRQKKETKERNVAHQKTKETNKRKFSLGRPRPPLLSFHCLALSPDRLVHVFPGPSRSPSPSPVRRPEAHPSVPQELPYSLRRLLTPQLSHRPCPRMLPPAILRYPLPKSLDLRHPRPTLCEEVVSRLSPPALAPPTCTRLHTPCPLMEEGTDGRVSRQ